MPTPSLFFSLKVPDSPQFFFQQSFHQPHISYMLGSAFLVMSLCPVRPYWPRTSTVISKQCPTFSLSCCCWGGTSFWLLLFCSETFFPLAKQDLFFAFLLFYFLGLEMVPACPSTVIVFSFVCTGLWSSRCSPDCCLSPRVSVACFLAVHRPAHSHTVLGPAQQCGFVQLV